MSGHSKWAQIKRKKGVTDQKRGQAFSKIVRMITLAAKTGADPETNFRLRLALEKAKEVNMPSSTVDRAIKGASKEGVALEEITYEGYGPFSVALLIQAVTDNKNRASSQIKSVLTKFGGSMGGTGSVSWIFSQKGLITINIKGVDKEARENLELKAIDLGAEDIKQEEDMLEVYTKPQEVHKIAHQLKNEGFKVDAEALEMQPKNLVKIEEQAKAEKVLKLLEELEDLEDVDQVYANFDIPAEILEKES